MSEHEIAELCVRALRVVGTAPPTARFLTRSVLDAERAGNRAVGLAHLFDYLDAYHDGRIVAGVVPQVTRSAPSCVIADAWDGLAQEAFEAAADELFTATRENGMAALWIRGSYTCGELGYYPRPDRHQPTSGQTEAPPAHATAFTTPPARTEDALSR